MGRIHENEVRLSTARVNLKNAHHALNISLISAYKNPRPDPLQAALEARNFGQVLEQFALLDRAQSYNASILTDIRDYRKDVDTSQRVLNRERNARRDTVAELAVAARARSELHRGRQGSATAASGQGAAADRGAPPGRDRGLAARRRAAAPGCRPRPTTQAVAVNDIGGVSSDSNSRRATPASRSRCPSPSTAGEAAVNFALGQLGTPYVWGGGAPGGFDCSGLVSWAYGQAGLGGLPHFTGALWNSGTHISSQGDLAPGDLVFFHGLGHVGLYIGGGNFVHAPHTGDVVKISNLGSYGGYVGAVRVSG